MILYHGSNVNIERIDLKKSHPNKDFGQGFYLSADYQQAWRMGEFRALIEGGEPIMNTYEFDESVMTSKELKPQMPIRSARVRTSESTRGRVIVKNLRMGPTPSISAAS